MKNWLGILREPFNCISHGVGAVLSVAGLIILLLDATTLLHYVAALFYGSTLTTLYVSSMVYHGLDVTERLLEFFHRIDRAAIYLFIAGTTTPIALIALRGWIGWTMFGLLWGIAVGGVVLSMFNPFNSRWSNTVLYLGMGWVSVVFIKPLINVFSTTALLWCIAGGLLYTIGACIYACDWPSIHAERFGAHELWHVFVMLGSASHFVLIVVYTI